MRSVDIPSSVLCLISDYHILIEVHLNSCWNKTLFLRQVRNSVIILPFKSENNTDTYLREIRIFSKLPLLGDRSIRRTTIRRHQFVARSIRRRQFVADQFVAEIFSSVLSIAQLFSRSASRKNIFRSVLSRPTHLILLN